MADRSYDEVPRPRIGVSACLLGHSVRFDGGHTRDRFLTDTLGRFVEWVPVCPEAEAGLGTPREAMRLVGREGVPRLIAVRSRRDLTDTLVDFAAARVAQLAALRLDGFVLKKGSPSCGLTRVAVYSEQGARAGSGRGLFADALCGALPALPVEEEGRLCDPVLRENFVERIFASSRLRDMVAKRGGVGDLVRFHTRHKLQLLAHSPARYAELGRLVATSRAVAPERRRLDYARAFMAALSAVATRPRHVNVLQHVAGYFRRVVPEAARRDMAAAIADYQRGLIPLVVPVRLLGCHVRLHGLDYLGGQVYFDPYPHELGLRNHV